MHKVLPLIVLALSACTVGRKFDLPEDIRERVWELLGDTLQALYCDDAEALYRLLTEARDSAEVESPPDSR